MTNHGVCTKIKRSNCNSVRVQTCNLDVPGISYLTEKMPKLKSGSSLIPAPVFKLIYLPVGTSVKVPPFMLEQETPFLVVMCEERAGVRFSQLAYETTGKKQSNNTTT